MEFPIKTFRQYLKKHLELSHNLKEVIDNLSEETLYRVHSDLRKVEKKGEPKCWCGKSVDITDERFATYKVCCETHYNYLFEPLDV